jgi:hypothetical protein
MGPAALPVGPGLFRGRIIQAGGLDDALDLPGGDGGLVRVPLAVDRKQLHLAVAQVLLAERDDLLVLQRAVLPEPAPAWPARSVLQAAQKVLLEPGQPFVEGLAGDAEVARSEHDIFAVLLPEDDPFQASLGRPGQVQEFGDLPPAVVLLQELVPAAEIPGLGRGEESAPLLLGD